MRTPWIPAMAPGRAGSWLPTALLALGLLPLAARATRAAPRLEPPHRVIATVPVGWRPYGVAVNPATHKVYVANNGSDTVSVIDPAKLAVVATVPVGHEPFYWLGVLPAANRVYVVNHGGGTVDGTLSVIDGASDTVVATIGGLGRQPVGIAVDPGRRRLYVEGDHRRVEIDADSHAVLRYDSVPGQSRGLVVDPVLDRGLSVYGATLPTTRRAWALPSHLPLGAESPGGGYPALDLLRHHVYLADPVARVIRVHDLGGLTDLASIPLALEPFIAAYDPERACLYTSNPGYIDLITVVDTLGRRELGAIRVGMQPTGVDVDPATGRVYVANTGSGTVSVIQGERCDLVGTATLTPVPTTATPGPAPTEAPYPYPAPPTATATRPPPTASPSATALGPAAPSATAAATTTARPSAGPTPPARCVCRATRQRVPAVALDDAVANPGRYLGWQQPLDPGKPPSPVNPPRACLTLQNLGLPYHPLWNRPIWRVGCP